MEEEERIKYLQTPTSPAAKIIFAPLVWYFAAGTAVLWFLYLMALHIKKIGKLTTNTYFRNKFQEIKWHRMGILHTVCFWLLFPILFIYYVALTIAVYAVYIYELIINSIVRTYRWITEQINSIWYKTSSKR